MRDWLYRDRPEPGDSIAADLRRLAAEVEDAVLLSGQRAASLGIALMNMVPDLPVPVMADKNRMRQVLVNVLDNAIKYSFTGGEVDVAVRQADGRIVARRGTCSSPSMASRWDGPSVAMEECAAGIRYTCEGNMTVNGLNGF